ncbi:MAG: hypothetical protein ACI88L_000565 [Candidatus Paceibacteria bacterium]|jgi:hypothetical protein
MKKKFKIKNKVWIWPGETANWFFIYVDEPFVLDIREWSKGKRGFGSVRVRSKTGKTQWESSMFWSKRENCYIFPLKAAVRKKEGIFDGDEIEVRFELI